MSDSDYQLPISPFTIRTYYFTSSSLQQTPSSPYQLDSTKRSFCTMLRLVAQRCQMGVRPAELVGTQVQAYHKNVRILLPARFRQAPDPLLCGKSSMSVLQSSVA